MAIDSDDKPTFAEAGIYVPNLALSESDFETWRDNVTWPRLTLDAVDQSYATDSDTQDSFKRAVVYQVLCDYYSDPLNQSTDNPEQTASKSAGSQSKSFFRGIQRPISSDYCSQARHWFDRAKWAFRPAKNATFEAVF